MMKYNYPSLKSFVRRTCGDSAANICKTISDKLFSIKRYSSSIDFAFDLSQELNKNNYHYIANVVSIWYSKLDEIVRENNNDIQVTYKDCIVT